MHCDMLPGILFRGGELRSAEETSPEGSAVADYLVKYRVMKHHAGITVIPVPYRPNGPVARPNRVRNGPVAPAPVHAPQDHDVTFGEKGITADKTAGLGRPLHGFDLA